MFKVVFYGMALCPAVILDREFKSRDQANDSAREAAKLLIKAGYFHYQVYGPDDQCVDHVRFIDRMEFQS